MVFYLCVYKFELLKIIVMLLDKEYLLWVMVFSFYYWGYSVCCGVRVIFDWIVVLGIVVSGGVESVLLVSCRIVVEMW